MKKRTKIILILIVLIATWWIMAAPPKDITIAEAHIFGEVPTAILALQEVNGDYLKTQQTTATDLPGHDDVVFHDSLQCAFVSGMDSWIWKIDLTTNKAEKFVKVPMSPSGMQLDPNDPMRLFFCTSRLSGMNHSADEKVGLYELNLATKVIKPAVLKLLKTPDTQQATVYLPKDRPTLALANMNEKNSRDFCLCNDLTISPDGNRIYMSEPLPLPSAAMGAGVIPHVIGMAPIGKMWLYDREKEQISLVLDHFTFVDGLVLDNKVDSMEAGVYFSETIKFSILKAYFEGEKAGTAEVMWENLPGMPDGLERDEAGNIWVGLIKKRSNIADFIHGNPWIKPFFLRLPHDLLPVTKETGLLAFSPDMKRPLFYTMHEGSVVTDISAVTAHQGKLYMSTFDLPQRGLHEIINPLK